jgi:thiol:disulfide interchange protein
MRMILNRGFRAFLAMRGLLGFLSLALLLNGAQAAWTPSMAWTSRLNLATAPAPQQTQTQTLTLSLRAHAPQAWGPGRPMWLGLDLQHHSGWHTGAQNPGDAGLPTTLAWQLPPGWTLGPAQWPPARLHEIGSLKTWVYEGHVRVKVPVFVAASAPANAVPRGTASALRVQVRVSWAACQTVCLREEATLGLSIHPQEALETDAAWFEGDAPDLSSVDGPPSSLSGWLWLLALGLAFAGGVVLNGMPCVLPVLCIKALALRRLADSQARWRHAWFYGLGVWAMCALLGGVVALLRWLGYQVGWGVQLQSPVVVGALAVLFAYLAWRVLGIDFGMPWLLSIPGIQRIQGIRWIRWIKWIKWIKWPQWLKWPQQLRPLRFLPRLEQAVNALANQEGAWGAWASGVLTVLVASPCMGPFMGAVMGWALVVPAWQGLGILMALGLGLALPYMLLSVYSGWLRFLPQPGPWMHRLQQVLALPLLCTSLWLASVWWQQIDFQSHGPLDSAGSPPSGSASSLTSTNAAAIWQTWAPGRAEALQAQGQFVLVDFTAAWCLTCRYNELTVLQEAGIVDRLRRGRVQLLKADWTRADPAITQALQKLGRSGIPVYALYPARPESAPRVLSEWLRVADLHQALDQVGIPR